MRKHFIIIILITLVSCEKPSDCTEHYFSDEYKSYIFFSEGSYWIYEDTLLGITDSIYLVYHSVHFDDNCTVSFQPQELLEQHFTSSYFKGNNNYNWSASGMAHLNEYLGGSLLGWYYDYDGISIDSMLIGGVWYNDIIEFSYQNDKYYRAKGIGLIKKEFDYVNSGDTIYNFELTRYHLN